MNKKILSLGILACLFCPLSYADFCTYLEVAHTYHNESGEYTADLYFNSRLGDGVSGGMGYHPPQGLATEAELYDSHCKFGLITLNAENENFSAHLQGFVVGPYIVSLNGTINGVPVNELKLE